MVADQVHCTVRTLKRERITLAFTGTFARITGAELMKAGDIAAPGHRGKAAAA